MKNLITFTTLLLVFMTAGLSHALTSGPIESQEIDYVYYTHVAEGLEDCGTFMFVNNEKFDVDPDTDFVLGCQPGYEFYEEECGVIVCEDHDLENNEDVVAVSEAPEVKVVGGFAGCSLTTTQKVSSIQITSFAGLVLMLIPMFLVGFVLRNRTRE